MWFAYVDESYNDDFHWVIGLLIEHARVNEGHRAMRDVMLRIEGAFPTIDAHDVELHGYDIFHGLGAFQAVEPRARVWIYNEAMAALSASHYKVILRGVNKEGLRHRYGDFAHPHRTCMAHLIERIDEFCVARDTHALVVADEHSETQTALLADLQTYQERGTWGYRARQITRVIDTIHFVPSFTNRLIQGADLAAFIARRFLSHEETDERTRRQCCNYGCTCSQASTTNGAGIHEPRTHKGPLSRGPKAGWGATKSTPNNKVAPPIRWMGAAASRNAAALAPRPVTREPKAPV